MNGMMQIDMLIKRMVSGASEALHSHAYTVYAPDLPESFAFAKDWVAEGKTGERKAILYTPFNSGMNLKVTVETED